MNKVLSVCDINGKGLHHGWFPVHSSKYRGGYYWKHHFLSRVKRLLSYGLFKDTNKEKALSDKTTALTKSMNTGIWVVGTSNQLFMKESETTETKYSKLR